MATNAELEARLKNLEGQFSAFIAGTIAPAGLSGAQRKQLENVIYPIIDGFRVIKGETNFDYINWEIGDEILDIDDTNKKHVAGKVKALPFNPATDLENTEKFELYRYDGPQIPIN